MPAGGWQGRPAAPEDDFAGFAQAVVKGGDQVAEGVENQQHEKAEDDGEQDGRGGGMGGGGGGFIHRPKAKEELCACGAAVDHLI